MNKGNRAKARAARLAVPRDPLGRPLSRRYAAEPYHRGGLRSAVIRMTRGGREQIVHMAEHESPWGYRVQCKKGLADSPRTAMPKTQAVAPAPAPTKRSHKKKTGVQPIQNKGTGGPRS